VTRSTLVALTASLCLLTMVGSAHAQVPAGAEQDEAPPPVVLGAPAAQDVGVVPQPPAAMAVAATGDPSVSWPSSATRPGPTGPPRVSHSEDVGQIALGATLLGLGYVGAVAWSARIFADLTLGNASCNDLYAGLHLVPVVGPLAGVGAAAGCVSFRFEEVFVPVVSTLLQLGGLVWLLVGLVGGDTVDYDGPIVSVSLDTSSASASVAGRF